MNQLTIFKSLAFVVILLTFVPLSLAQNQAVSQKPPLALSVTQKADGVYVMSSGAVSDFALEEYVFSRQRVFISAPVSSGRLWNFSNNNLGSNSRRRDFQALVARRWSAEITRERT